MTWNNAKMLSFLFGGVALVVWMASVSWEEAKWLIFLFGGVGFILWISIRNGVLTRTDK